MPLLIRLVGTTRTDFLYRFFPGTIRPLLAAVRAQHPSAPPLLSNAPVVVHWNTAVELLRSEGFSDVDPLGDLSSAQELCLGTIVRREYL